MTGLTVVRAAKNLKFVRYRAEREIDAAADETRARFATPGKHTIYDKKLQEAQRYLDAVSSGNPPEDLKKFPYMSREVGPDKTAATPEDLANLWITMNGQWEQVSPVIEDISITAKSRVKTARSAADIEQIKANAIASLDAIGEKPPENPRSLENPVRRNPAAR
jgi:hypothetical protein